MSIDILRDSVCIDTETGYTMNHHSILVGEKCAYCMNCGKIIIEYKNKNDFKRLINPITSATDSDAL